MIRIKIRWNSSTAEGKILRFEKNEVKSLESLLQQIATKLGVRYASNKFKLLLRGEFLVENVGEIDNADELVLMERTVPEDPICDDASSCEEPLSDAPIRVEDLASQDQVKQEPNEEFSSGTPLVGSTFRRRPARPEAPIPETVSSSTSNNRVTRRPNQRNNAETKKQRVRNSANDKNRDKNSYPLTSDGDTSQSSYDSAGSDDSIIEEGSDAWERNDEPDEKNDSDFETNCESEKKQKFQRSRKRKRERRPVESPLQVLMDEKDVPAAPGKPMKQKDEDLGSKNMDEASTLVDRNNPAQVDQAVKDRIIKLLNTGFHEMSNENEAKNAMKLAQRLMRKHNLSQALLLKERDARDGEAGSEETLKGGMVHVSIVNRKTGKPALFARWIASLTNPISKNFDVKSFYSVARGRKCTVTFYGIYTNAQLAGYAFRVATEKISLMASQHRPDKFSSVATSSSRLSYAIGVVKGISDEIDESIRREKEQRERKLQRARMAASAGEAYEESDDEREIETHEQGYCFSETTGAEWSSTTRAADATPSNLNLASSYNAVLSPRTRSASGEGVLSGTSLDRRVKELEQEERAALVLFNHNEKVAEQVLKDNDVKLSAGRKRKTIKFEYSSYRKGIKDSEEVDINQRAIRDGVTVKEENR